MPKHTQLLVALVLAVGLACQTPGQVNGQSIASKRFSSASVRFEQNATDGDVEVVIEVIGPDEGLANLSVVAPDGRTVVDFTSRDASKYGIREFVFESPEPTDVPSLKSAFPEGTYTFDGANAEGVRFQGTSPLSHELPPTVSFVHPTARAPGVEVENLVITWTPVAGVSGYVVELEQARLDMKLIINQPATTAEFAVPNGLLVPGMKYQLGIGTVSADGNVSFVETSFTTTGQN